MSRAVNTQLAFSQMSINVPIPESYGFKQQSFSERALSNFCSKKFVNI